MNTKPLGGLALGTTIALGSLPGARAQIPPATNSRPFDILDYGNIYRASANGGRDRFNSSGGWDNVQPLDQNRSLDSLFSSQNFGSQRASSWENHGWQDSGGWGDCSWGGGGGWGGGSFGGFRGGGFDGFRR